MLCVCVNLLKTKHVQISNTPRFLLPFHSQSIFPNPSDTKISHPPRTYIKFLCRKDIEKGHPRSERCRTIGYTAVALQFLQPGCPTFQQTFGEPGRDEVLKVSQNPASFPWDFFLRLWHAMAIGLARDLYVYMLMMIYIYIYLSSRNIQISDKYVVKPFEKLEWCKLIHDLPR